MGSALVRSSTSARLREFYREPAAVFWVFGFPLILAVALGLAFRDSRSTAVARRRAADGRDAAAAEQLRGALAADPGLTGRRPRRGDRRQRLRTGEDRPGGRSAPGARRRTSTCSTRRARRACCARNAADRRAAAPRAARDRAAATETAVTEPGSAVHRLPRSPACSV